MLRPVTPEEFGVIASLLASSAALLVAAGLLRLVKCVGRDDPDAL